jgi:GWxTD domain-containing protein
MKTRLLLCLAVMALVVPALMAGGLEKYKNWPNSPQGYFMTASERADWKASVKTDADAEQFIKNFLAKRDAGFADDVAKRAEMADKHLTVGGRAGSLTTRGKIVILLGPPTSFNIGQRDIKGNVSASSEMYGGVSDAGRGGGGGQGPSVGDMTMAASRQGMSGGVLKDYTFVYAGDKLPVKQPKDLTVTVEVRPNDGTDRINDRRVAAQLDDLFEAVAAARVAAAAPAPKP